MPLYFQTLLKLCEKRVLRRMFGRKMKEATGDWRKLRNEKSHYFIYSASVIRMIASITMRLVGM
jgi:intracellular septation protein A